MTWNAGAEQLLGYSEAEVIGQNFSLFFTDEDRTARVPQTELAKAASSGYAYDDRWHLCKDGTRIYVNGGLCLLRADGEPFGFVKIVRNQTEKREGWRLSNETPGLWLFHLRFHPHRGRPATVALEKRADASLVARDAERLEMINDLLPALPLPAHLRDEREVWRELRLKRFSGH